MEELGGWEGILCERFVLRWLLLPTWERQAGKARTSGAYPGAGTAEPCSTRTRLARWAGTAACGPPAGPRADRAPSVMLFLGSARR